MRVIIQMCWPRIYRIQRVQRSFLHRSIHELAILIGSEYIFILLVSAILTRTKRVLLQQLLPMLLFIWSKVRSDLLLSFWEYLLLFRQIQYSKLVPTIISLDRLRLREFSITVIYRVFLAFLLRPRSILILILNLAQIRQHFFHLRLCLSMRSACIWLSLLFYLSDFQFFLAPLKRVKIDNTINGGCKAGSNILWRALLLSRVWIVES